MHVSKDFKIPFLRGKIMQKNVFIKIISCVFIFFVGVFCVFTNPQDSSKDALAQINLDYGESNITVNNYVYTMLYNTYPDYSSSYDGEELPEEYCMRDEYFIPTTMQGSHGICWSFAGNTALSTTIMKQTKEYYNFSEAWMTTAFNGFSHDNVMKSQIGATGNYYVGGGGIFIYFDVLCQKYGVMLEQDFSFEDLQVVCNENADDMVKNFSQYANFEILENVKGGKFINYIESYSRQTTMNSIKQHILKNGAVYASYLWGGENSKQLSQKTIYYKKPNVQGGGHAVSIIGWDDDFSLTVDGTKYTGAWIAMSSWGNAKGDEGIYYIFYDDATLNEMWGYKWTGDAKDLFLTTTIEDCSNPYYTNLKGAYYGNYSGTSAKTQQKNVFFNDDINLTYSYTTSNGAEVISAEVFKQEQCVDNIVDADINHETKKIIVSGTDVPVGAYKVVVTYSDGTNTEKSINNFYVFDGGEINYAKYNFNFSGDYASNNDGGSINNNGFYQIIDDEQTHDGDIVVATTKQRGVFLITFVAETYSDIASISCTNMLGKERDDLSDEQTGTYGFQINYNLTTSEAYPFQIKTKDGKIRIVNLIILSANTDQTMTRVFYETNGGENNANNNKQVLVASNGRQVIYAPTRTGYEFKGWYTDAKYTTALIKSGNEYYIRYSNIKIEQTPEVDSGMQEYVDSFYSKSAYVFLYAKWEKIQNTITINYYSGNSETVPINDGEVPVLEDPTREGYKFVGWYTDAGYTTVWDPQAPIVGNINIYAKWQQIKTFTVTINYNNGMGSKTEYVQENTALVAPTAKYEGYNLVGWYTDSNFTTQWNFSNLVTGNMSLYAKWEKNSLTVFFNPNNGGGVIIGSVEYGETVAEPNVSYLGYTLVGWYEDAEFKNLFDFSQPIKNSINLYAKWELNNPLNLSIISSTEQYLTYSNFTLTLMFDHEIKVDCTISIDWYLNGELLQTTTGATLQQRMTTSGTYSYSAELTIFNNGSLAKASLIAPFVVIVNERPVEITNIQYLGNGNFTWEDSVVASYKVSLFKQNHEGDIFVGEKDVILYTTQINIWELIVDAGTYYISIEKTVGEDIIGSINSETFDVVFVDYVTFLQDSSNYEQKIYDINQQITSMPISPSRDGYDFVGWFLDANYENALQIPHDIKNNTTIYANWVLNDLMIEEIFNIETVYVKLSSYEVVVNCSHIISGQYSYCWYKNVDGTFAPIENQTNSITFEFVKDSGEYYCEVTMVDQDGFKVTGKSNIFVVNIEKAETIINVASIRRHYEYTGFEQKIESGARIERLDEPVNILYQNNTFTNVPEGGILMLFVIAPETENYKGARTEVELTINKKQGEIFASEYQSGTYSGKNFSPQYTLNNKEQKVEFLQEVKNAGRYENVLLVAKESQNYMETSIIITVEIFKAPIVVKIKNITSIWMFPAKELEFEVEGEYTDSVELTLTCNVDVYKIGTYEINVEVDNPNYIITPIKGVYKVTAFPYYAGFMLLILAIIFISIIHSKKKVMLDFEENGGSLIAPIETANKKEIAIQTPKRKGYDFVGWYYDKELTKPFDNKYKRGKVVQLHAKWEEAKHVDAKDRSIESILEELNIKPKATPVEEVEKLEEENITETEGVAMQPDIQDQEETIESFIERAQENNKSEISKKDLNKVLEKLNLSELKEDEQIQTEVQKPKELTIEELIEKANSSSYIVSSNEDIVNLINDIIDKE